MDILATVHPDLISAKHLNYIFAALKDTSLLKSARIIFQAFIPVANHQPEKFDVYCAQLLHLVIEHQDICVFGCLLQYLIASVITRGEQTAKENINTLIYLLKDNKTSNDIRSSIFRGCQLIGSDLACQSLIDYIDGTKMTIKHQATIKQAQTEMEQIEKRTITNIRTCVNEVDTRLIDVAEQVQVHIHEIERIDAKTLSYVPEWGAGVSKLLNSPASNNWCLLGKRFGYSTSELRHWATKADPCMTLLNEWYMTHETDETTYGLVKMLEDIGRHDAEKIIREAVIAAGKVIPEELDIEMKRLPPVFLSYQWGIQAAVTTLKSHLEQAGYACWMDTGQMGGGDKLFAKIDAGIRGAKIVICCMAAAYAQSVNCSREIHPCVSTGKPIIPLQMEKQPWPPEGALGPIMSEYLFIRFFDRKNAGTVNYWPEEKFAELLGQIRYHVAPDTDMISSQYNNWFVAQIDNLIFLQLSKSKNDKKVENKESTSLIDTPLEVSHPQLMISYQWDHQSYIVALYKRLTLLGYRVWLDIFQMGGGDSLFEKIDTGIRHSLCVIACVTPKYTVSINCRREMALADALSIPIIPLLLQETSTWPPPGPMALVFAEKPYINFSSKNEQSNNDNTWIGKEFQELLSRLRKFVPDVQLQTAQRNLPGMERPISAAQTGGHSVQQQPKRITSAPAIDKSQTCSLI
ncbi:unnamed protein product [Rotaria socialis]|uniref:TIR domain-containing protein n=1 Tax=Rotaria socialis TaxID=392032 RepID=A0A821M6I7_9BILA|nr:unnamed protein product [Rotaria socialis]CAF4432287.1 unnamed protein product [Rotaria socialis]CAF4493473.1 unnamed protein product [Rotaria socialis]CAF4762990.1 unnamed protein product [Rotaria socialis]